MARVVLEVLKSERELNEIAAENNLKPNLLRNWKQEFIQNAEKVFSETRSEKEVRKKEAEPERARGNMLKATSPETIGLLPIGPDTEEVPLFEIKAAPQQIRLRCFSVLSRQYVVTKS